MVSTLQAAGRDLPEVEPTRTRRDPGGFLLEGAQRAGREKGLVRRRRKKYLSCLPFMPGLHKERESDPRQAPSVICSTGKKGSTTRGPVKSTPGSKQQESSILGNEHKGKKGRDGKEIGTSYTVPHFLTFSLCSHTPPLHRRGSCNMAGRPVG